jgi:hypothetical protein
MGAILRRLSSRGLDVIQGAMNDNPGLPNFIRSYGVNFPLGAANGDRAREFMQISVMQQTAYLPWFAIVDRKGMIREQHFGDEALFAADEVRRMETLLEKYLAERPGAPAAAPKKR